MKKILFMMTMMLSLGTMSFGQGGYSIGDKVEDFSLKGVDGKSYTLTDYSDKKGTIVIFTCNHCPYSVLYEDRIIALQDEFGPKGFQVLAINPNDPIAQPDDSYEAMVLRAKEKAFNFPYLFDDGQKVYPKFGATRTPHVFLVDKAMTLRYIGAIDDNARDESSVGERYLAKAINAIAEGKEVNPTTTKAIGCSIKTQ